MSKESSVTVKIKVDKKSIDALKAFADAGQKAQAVADKLILDFEGAPESKEPEIVIIEQSAIPAGYFMRPDVQAAVLAEIIKDYKATGQVAPGAELISQEEESDGETEKVSDQKNDSSVGDDGPAAQGDSGNNGGQASGSGEDHPGDSAQESGDDGSSSDQKSGDEKPGTE